MVDRVAGDLEWYCSDAYAVHARGALPEPLVFLHARQGLPVTEAHRAHFSIRRGHALGATGTMAPS